MRPNEIMLSKAKLYHASKPVEDIRQKVEEILRPLEAVIKSGDRIALAAGSRGIANIGKIIKYAADFVKALGAQPFVVPAMGSHGGATAEGQAELLAGYGISEEETGVPVLSSMETEYLGDAECDTPFPVHFDRNAFHSDGVIVINRVKSHTDFHGYHESGIVKMLVIGLGKQKQAEIMHRFGADGLRDLLPVAARTVLESGKIIGGIGILEDGYENTSDLVFASPDNYFEVDHALLMRSKELMAKLPFPEIDVLLIDNMGKDISGTGMDTNVIGRMRIKGQPDESPDCDKIVVLNLTPPSHGNATGIGLADITTKRLADSIDWNATNENMITSGFLQRGFLPIVAEDDERAVDVAINGGYYTEETIRFARIKDTLHLEEVYLSKALMEQLIAEKKGEQVGEYQPLSFAGGTIAEF